MIVQMESGFKNYQSQLYLHQTQDQLKWKENFKVEWVFKIESCEGQKGGLGIIRFV